MKDKQCGEFRFGEQKGFEENWRKVKVNEGE